MGRIGHSLIMLGQLPHCSLFSVCWADDGLRVPVRGLERACVCIHKHAFLRWDKPMAGKRDPTLSPPPTPPPPCLKSMPLQIGFYITEAVRYEQLIFLSLFLVFFFYSLFLSLSHFYFCVSSFFFMSILSFISPFPLALPSWYSEPVFSFHSVCLCNLCCRHLPVGLNSPVCVLEHISVIRMLTISPPPASVWWWISIHHQIFASFVLCLFIEVVWLVVFIQ